MYVYRKPVSLVVALVAAVVLPLSSAAAGPSEDKARVDAHLAQVQATLEAATERARTAAAAHAAATASLPGAETSLADAKGRVVAAEAAARRADREAAAAHAKAAEAARAAELAGGRVEDARAAVGDFVAAAYKGSGVVAVNNVLDAASPSDLAERMGYLNRLAADHRRTIAVLAAARAQAGERQRAADEARATAEAARAAAGRALANSQGAVRTAEDAAGRVRALVAEQARALTEANQERAAVLARYNEVKADSDRIAAALRAQARSAGGGGNAVLPPPSGGGGGGRLLMPTRGYKSSDYGMRYDPYYKVWQLHAGVDIAAGGGEAIYAAADGTVVQAGWSGGYGRYTCVAHGRHEGRSLATCYAHQSQISVGAGQTVRRGQVIGRVGTTGASTGDHLHFEVRLDGNPVDPLAWLPGCLC